MIAHVFAPPFFSFSFRRKKRTAAPGEEKKGDDQRTFRMVLWTLHRPEPCSGLAAYGSLGFCRIRRQRNERHQQDRVRHGKCFRFCMARFLFFLKEKEKDGFKNVSLPAMVGKMRVASLHRKHLRSECRNKRGQHVYQWIYDDTIVFNHSL